MTDQPSLRASRHRVFSGLLVASLFCFSPDASALSTGFLSVGNPFLDGLLVFAMLVVIWAAFYWGVYPKALRRFGETSARSIFWSGLVLWSLTVVYFSLFFVYTFGFLYLWIQWSLPLLVLFSTIWFFLASFIRN